MISITYSSIPSYLHESAFYKALSVDESNEEIQIPVECFKINDIVEDVKSFAQLLKVTLFWGLDKIPSSIIYFCDQHKLSSWVDVATEVLGNESSLLTDLRTIFTASVMAERIVLAITVNRVEILEFLLSYSTIEDKCSADPANKAAELGLLSWLQSLYGHRFLCDERTTCAAARAGHLLCLQYLHETGCGWDEDTVRMAAKYGHLKCLQYAHQHGCPWDQSVGQRAGENGHADCLRFALELNSDIEYDDYGETLRGGHLHCLQVLHEFHYPWSELCMYEAAVGGNLQCVQYLHEHCLCAWDASSTFAVAGKNHVEVLRYLIEHDCPCDDDILEIAAIHGSLDCIHYLLTEQTKHAMHMSQPLFGAAFQHAQVECVVYLLKVGCPFVDVFEPHDGPFYAYSICREGDYDARFLQCIKLVCGSGWSVSGALRQYVLQYANVLPLCHEHLIG